MLHHIALSIVIMALILLKLNRSYHHGYIKQAQEPYYYDDDDDYYYHYYY